MKITATTDALAVYAKDIEAAVKAFLSTVAMFGNEPEEMQGAIRKFNQAAVDAFAAYFPAAKGKERTPATAEGLAAATSLQLELARASRILHQKLTQVPVSERSQMSTRVDSVSDLTEQLHKSIKAKGAYLEIVNPIGQFVTEFGAFVRHLYKHEAKAGIMNLATIASITGGVHVTAANWKNIGEFGDWSVGFDGARYFVASDESESDFARIEKGHVVCTLKLPKAVQECILKHARTAQASTVTSGTVRAAITTPEAALDAVRSVFPKAWINPAHDGKRSRDIVLLAKGSEFPFAVSFTSLSDDPKDKPYASIGFGSSFSHSFHTLAQLLKALTLWRSAVANLAKLPSLDEIPGAFVKSLGIENNPQRDSLKRLIAAVKKAGKTSTGFAISASTVTAKPRDDRAAQFAVDLNAAIVDAAHGFKKYQHPRDLDKFETDVVTVASTLKSEVQQALRAWGLSVEGSKAPVPNVYGVLRSILENYADLVRAAKGYLLPNSVKFITTNYARQVKDAAVKAKAGTLTGEELHNLASAVYAIPQGISMFFKEEL